MATNCDSCGHRTNEVSWKEGVLCCVFVPELPVQLLGGKLDLGGIVRRCFMLGGEATVPGLEWPLGWALLKHGGVTECELWSSLPAVPR